MPSFRFTHDFVDPPEAYVVVGMFALVGSLLAHRILRFSMGRSILLALPSAVALYLVIAICLDASIADYPRRTFNTESWLRSPDKRYEMMEDLLAKDTLIGMNSEQVNALLGRSDGYLDAHRLEYRLGYSPGFSFLTVPGGAEDILQLRFENGTVSDMELLFD